MLSIASALGKLRTMIPRPGVCLPRELLKAKVPGTKRDKRSLTKNREPESRFSPGRTPHKPESEAPGLQLLHNVIALE